MTTKGAPPITADNRFLTKTMKPGIRRGHVAALWLFLLTAAGAIAFSRQTAPAADANGGPNERLREAASSLASLERQIAEVVKKAEPSVVQCLAPRDIDENVLNQRLAPGEKGIFSGTIVTAEGHIVSCAHHGLAPGTPVTLRLSDGRTVPGKVLGRHKRWDLSMLKIIAPGPWPHVELGASTGALPGDLYVLLGYPRRYLVVNRHKPVRPSVRLAWGLNAVRDSGDLPSRVRSTQRGDLQCLCESCVCCRSCSPRLS